MNIRRGFVGPSPPSGDFELNRDSPQARGLQVCWPLPLSRGDGGEGLSVGTLKDISGYGLSGNTFWGQYEYDPVMGLSFKFTNDGRYFSGGSHSLIRPLIDSFSYSLWLNSLNSVSWESLFAHGTTGVYIYLLMGSAGQFDTRISSSDGTIDDTVRGAGYDDGIPHHVILSMNRATDELIIFTDGKQVGAVIDISVVNGTFDIVNPLNYGIRGTSQYESSAKIADPRIYRRALTLADSEIMYDPATRWDLYKPITPQLWPVVSAIVPSASVSPSISPSTSVSPSESVSASPSVSPSVSVSVSPSVSLSVSLSISPSASPSPAVSGEVTWGHDTGVAEANVLDFAGNWTGTGEIISSGDDEQICLDVGEYMESDIVDTSAFLVTLFQNLYDGTGDDATLRYRHGATPAACVAAAWNNYTVSFISLGFVQVRLEAA